MVFYTNWCFSHAQYYWTFRWDADMIATQPLLDFLNAGEWTSDNCAYRLSAQNATTKNSEYYLTSGLLVFSKFYFWELPVYKKGCKMIDRADLIIRHASELKDLKSYWSEAPWYLSSESEEATRVRRNVEKLTQDYGSEPPGVARASNPECDALFNAIQSNPPCYVKCKE